ncbi:MAG: hypothetical protein LUH04_01780 [Clostridium sp.]|nr:hypothetical protein [Clostridium sp.]
MKKYLGFIIIATALTVVLSGCQKKETVSNIPLLENNEELTDELVADIPYTYYGKNDNWEITLVVRQDTDEEMKLFQQISGDDTAYRTELFVKASDDMKQQVLSGELFPVVIIPREDGREFTSLLPDPSKENNRKGVEEMLNGEAYWVIGENSKHYSTGLMMSKEDSYTATVTTTLKSSDSNKEEIILSLQK